MTREGSRTPHDHGVEPVQTDNGNEITRLNKIFINIHVRDVSPFHVVLHCLGQEVNVFLFHVAGHVGTNYWNERMVRDTTNKCLKGPENGFNRLNQVFTEDVGFDTTEGEVFFGVVVGNRER